MLLINNVCKKYEDKYANKNISLSVDDGSIIGFVGPNGAGKSTLIKSIVGLHTYDSGEITLNGINIKENELEYKGMISYIPDNPDIYETLTGINYLNFICDIFKVSKEERVKEIERLADIFDIKDALTSQIGTYSHGMRQKLVIIASLVHSPKLLIMDEPFVGLDPKSSHDLKILMQEHVNKGNIIFFSSHVLEVVEKLCDHIAIINKGEIIYDSKKNSEMEESLEEFFLRVTANE